ncbi:1,4-dihydroxy-2-naphthoyl-CoA hydrolase [Streptacidiphilus sp. MAP12-33]|uniref:PaaI family thioesterase n=1 Tax=Streptacidiphilus sp. MAP12-33 TaxID=3156266 RepID=UPI0035158599
MTLASLGDIPVLDPYADEQLTERLGIRITECTAGRVVGTMPVAGNRQPVGILHGGANAAFAETLGSLGAWMHAGPDRIIVGQELSCTHLAAARRGVLTGTATALHLGRTSATYEIRITDEAGTLACVARLTCAVPARRRTR